RCIGARGSARAQTPSSSRGRRRSTSAYQRGQVRQLARRASNGLQRSLTRMASKEPDLAARLLLQALPAASTQIEGRLGYRVVLEGVGAYDVSTSNGGASVVPVADPSAANGRLHFEPRPDA